MPILQELLKDDNSEVELNVVNGLVQIAKVLGIDLINSGQILSTLTNMTKDGQWRVRMGVFELIADLAIIYGKDVYVKHLQNIFMGYLTNTAASVRQMGVQKSAVLAEAFKEGWIMQDYIPVVINHYATQSTKEATTTECAV